MPREKTTQTPTDQEIMAYNNVPVDVAARYIGWSSCNIYRALQQERAPYGSAVQTGKNKKTGAPTWSYHISPGMLVKYKRGDLPAYRLNEVIKLAADGIEEILDERLAAVASLVHRPDGRRRGRVG